MLTKEQIKEQGRNKETAYPSSCDKCPNNPNNYENLETPVITGIDFSEEYIKEMGGDEDNTL